jgi:hypothetical protein
VSDNVVPQENLAAALHDTRTTSSRWDARKRPGEEVVAHDPKKVEIKGRSLLRHHCGGRLFVELSVQIEESSALGALLGGLTDRAASCFTCSDCGYVHSFLRSHSLL